MHYNNSKKIIPAPDKNIVKIKINICKISGIPDKDKNPAFIAGFLSSSFKLEVFN